MLFDIIVTVQAQTRKYSYTLNTDGTRQINKNYSSETLTFKFDSTAIEQIIMRNGAPVLRVDDKEMYFDYKNGSLKSIHFENQEHIWFVEDYKDFLSQCREAYIRQKVTERFLGIMDQTNASQKEDLSEILDEFDIAGIEDVE